MKKDKLSRGYLHEKSEYDHEYTIPCGNGFSGVWASQKP